MTTGKHKVSVKSNLEGICGGPKQEIEGTNGGCVEDADRKMVYGTQRRGKWIE